MIKTQSIDEVSTDLNIQAREQAGQAGEIREGEADIISSNMMSTFC